MSAGDATAVRLTQHQDIVVTFGTASELPTPIPSTYSASISSTCAPDCLDPGGYALIRIARNDTGLLWDCTPM